MKYYITVIFFIIFCTNCTPRHTAIASGEISADSLIRKGMETLFTGDKAMLSSLLISRAEFKQSIFPNFPESSQMAADDFWEVFIVKRRDARIGDMMKKFNKLNCSLLSVGTPKKSTPMKSITIHYQTPVEFECKATAKGDVWREKDSRLFGSIVEDRGKFKWLNAFWD